MQYATYKPNPNERIEQGKPALVDVVEHPTCSNCTVRTTEVISYDAATGVFVTDNTEFHLSSAKFHPVEAPATEAPVAPVAPIPAPKKVR